MIGIISFFRPFDTSQMARRIWKSSVFWSLSSMLKQPAEVIPPDSPSPQDGLRNPPRSNHLPGLFDLAH